MYQITLNLISSVVGTLSKWRLLMLVKIPHSGILTMFGIPGVPLFLFLI